MKPVNGIGRKEELELYVNLFYIFRRMIKGL
jgi:hypothetical protein